MGEFQVNETEEVLMEMRNKAGDGGGGGGGAGCGFVTKWERFLPKMVVRVLLVESDDSTRQIIAALLRKCNYRVATAPDGLKAWEVLKERHCYINLVLTEVELPSISGYALLTLMMEHDNCKNIPVIMMSKHDSVSTVYKCMLRGAADFLVKPVRRNELRNLWQHVWRRKASSSSALGPPDESIGQQKVEAMAENNAISNYSSDFMECIQTNRECIEKASDAQSSCTKPEVETEEADAEHVQRLSQKRLKTVHPNEKNISAQERHQVTDNRAILPDDDGRGTQVASNIADKTIHREDQHYREAIDLIGAFNNYRKGTCKAFDLNSRANKNDLSPLLDLSLRRSDPSCSVNQVTDERPRLIHSDASAFSRYVNKTSQPPHSTSHSKEFEISSKHTFDYDLNTHVSPLSSFKQVSVSTVEPGQAEIRHPYTDQKVATPFPVPIPGLRFENPGNTLYRPQVHSFYPPYNHTGPTRINDATDQANNRQETTLETFEDGGHKSSTTDQSRNSSFCNGTLTRLYSLGSVNHVVSSTELASNQETAKIEEVTHLNDGNSHRAAQREAALTKFRLKRKERCYGKKVRYESRKKLAEQRPRVKGQFVRHEQNDQPPVIVVKSLLSLTALESSVY